MANMDRLHISRVPDRNGVSLLYIMLEIHPSGREPSNFALAVVVDVVVFVIVFVFCVLLLPATFNVHHLLSSDVGCYIIIIVVIMTCIGVFHKSVVVAFVLFCFFLFVCLSSFVT